MQAAASSLMAGPGLWSGLWSGRVERTNSADEAPHTVAALVAGWRLR